MKNQALSFLKERSTYVLFGAISLLLIIVIGLVSCSDGEKTGPGLIVSWKSGEILFSANGEIWEFADQGTLLEADFMLKTGDESKVILKTPQGGFVRLSENSEIKISSVSKKDLLLTQSSGRSFHRVKKHKTDVYQVSVFGNTIKAIGTAFDIATNKTAKRINVKVLYGKVEVDVNYDGIKDPLQVIKGKEVTVDPAASPVFKFADINEDYLKSEWFKWNRLEEKQAGYSLRIVDDILKGGDESETSAPAETPPKASTTAPKTTTTPKVSAPAKTTASGSSACRPYLTAKKSRTYGGILLNWNACKPAPEGFQFYKVVRSSKNTNPSYPNDPIVSSSSNSSYASYIDKEVAPSRTYYYRVCVIVRLKSPSCSNVATATY